MDDTVDLLKIKIEKAKRELPLETVNAIDAVDWKLAILELRSKKGYTFEQLGDLELETELLLAGLVSPESYPKELSKRMKINPAAANELVNEMNDLVFKKIREELVKNTERKKIFKRDSIPPTPKEVPVVSTKNKAVVFDTTSTTIIPEKLELTGEVHPMLTQKLSGSVKIPTVQTEHFLENITKTAPEVKIPGGETPKIYPKNADPYRLSPDE